MTELRLNFSERMASHDLDLEEEAHPYSDAPPLCVSADLHKPEDETRSYRGASLPCESKGFHTQWHCESTPSSWRPLLCASRLGYPPRLNAKKIDSPPRDFLSQVSTVRLARRALDAFPAIAFVVPSQMWCRALPSLNLGLYHVRSVCSPEQSDVHRASLCAHGPTDPNRRQGSVGECLHVPVCMRTTSPWLFGPGVKQVSKDYCARVPSGKQSLHRCSGRGQQCEARHGRCACRCTCIKHGSWSAISGIHGRCINDG